MKKIVLAMFISSLALPVLAQTNTTEEAASKVLLGCLYDTGAQLDDGVSSVETIAKVVATSCQKESAAFVDILIGGRYPVDREKLLQASYEKNINTASYFILRIRASKNK